MNSILFQSDKARASKTPSQPPHPFAPRSHKTGKKYVQNSGNKINILIWLFSRKLAVKQIWQLLVVLRTGWRQRYFGVKAMEGKQISGRRRTRYAFPLIYDFISEVPRLKNEYHVIFYKCFCIHLAVHDETNLGGWWANDFWCLPRFLCSASGHSCSESLSERPDDFCQQKHLGPVFEIGSWTCIYHSGCWLDACWKFNTEHGSLYTIKPNPDFLALAFDKSLNGVHPQPWNEQANISRQMAQISHIKN